MAWFLGQSIVIIALAFALGVLVGWLIWGRLHRPAGESAAPAPAETAATAPVASEPRAAEPAALELPASEPAVPEPAVPEPAAPVPATLETVAPVSPVTVPAMVQDAVPDNLERIEGIGPKMAAALQRGGVRTYRQLADTTEASLREMIEAADLHFAPSLNTWARQARLLADGDEAGFAELTRRLVAGRDVGR